MICMPLLSQTLLLAVLVASVWQPAAVLQDRRKAASTFREQEDISPSSCQFERIDGSGLNVKSFVRKVANRRTPLLLYNVDNWKKLSSNVSEESSLARYGDRLVAVEAVTSRNRSQFKLGAGMQSFRSYVLKGDRRSNADIVFDIALSSNFSRSLWKEKSAHVPKFLRDFKALPVVSAGALGTGAGMHRHQEAWLLALHGRKAWWIGESDAGENNFYGTLSPCQYLGADLPLRYSFCVQHPGELLYLPDASWHATCNIDDLVLGIGAHGRTGEWPPLMKHVSHGDLRALENELKDLSPERILDSSALATALDHALALGYDDLAERLSNHSHVTMESQPPLDRNMPTSLLHAATRADSEMLATRFQDAGFSAHEPFNTFSDDTAFDRSAERGNIGLLRTLAKAKTSLSLSWNRKAAHIAAESGHIEILQELKSLGIDVRAPGGHGQRPIHGAAAGGDVPVAMGLIGKGRLHIEALDDNGNVPMHAAAEQGHLGMLEFLLDHGANIDIGNAENLQPFHIAAVNGHVPAVSYLLEQRADMMVEGLEGTTALHLCASAGHADVVDLLLERGSEVNAARSEKHITPLQDAAKSGANFVAKLLIRRKADVPTALLQGGDAKALNLAAAAGHRSLTELLVSHAPAASQQALIDEASAIAVRHGHKHIQDFLNDRIAHPRNKDSEL